MLSFLEDYWASGGIHRFALKTALILGITSGTILGLTNFASSYKGISAPIAALAGNLFLILILFWISFPFLKVIERLVNSRNRIAASAIDAFLGSAVTILGLTIGNWLVYAGFTSQSSDLFISIGLGIIAANLIYFIPFSIYYHWKQDKLPLEINFHLILGLVTVLVALPIALGLSSHYDSSVKTKTTGGMFDGAIACKSAVSASCRTENAPFIIPEICGEMGEEAWWKDESNTLRGDFEQNSTHVLSCPDDY